MRQKIDYKNVFIWLNFLACGFIIFASLRNEDEVKSVLTVERINIVDKDGTLRMVISNEDRFPAPKIEGKEIDLRQGPKDPGIIFYNDEGDECGGLMFGSNEIGSEKVAGTSLLFDQYRQDQVLQLMYHDEIGKNQMIGLQINDKPEDFSLMDLVNKYLEIQDIKDNEERNKKMTEMQVKSANGDFGSERLFVGTINDVPILSLKSKSGKPLIEISINNETPSFIMYNVEGEEILRLPNSK